MDTKNLLYLGPGEDILSLFQFEKDFDNIYLIDNCSENIDDCNNKIRFELYKFIIKKILLSGIRYGMSYHVVKSDSEAYCNVNFIINSNTCCNNKTCKRYTIIPILNNINQKCEIEEEIHKLNYMYIKFKFNDKLRNLYVFNNDYNTIWNYKIQNITHLFIMGIKIDLYDNLIKNMCKTRLNEHCKIYAFKNYFNNNKFKKKIIVNNIYEYISLNELFN
jgi:hypothetical protein